MAELATIARPYAEALYQSARADLGGTSEWLEALAAIAGNEQLLQFAGNPKVTDSQVYDLVTGVTKAALPAAAQNFLRTVIENGRLAALPDYASIEMPRNEATLRWVRVGSRSSLTESGRSANDTSPGSGL